MVSCQVWSQYSSRLAQKTFYLLTKHVTVNLRLRASTNLTQNQVFFQLNIWTCTPSFMKIGWSVFEMSCSQTDGQTFARTHTRRKTLCVNKYINPHLRSIPNPKHTPIEHFTRRTLQLYRLEIRGNKTWVMEPEEGVMRTEDGPKN